MKNEIKFSKRFEGVFTVEVRECRQKTEGLFYMVKADFDSRFNNLDKAKTYCEWIAETIKEPMLPKEEKKK